MTRAVQKLYELFRCWVASYDFLIFIERPSSYKLMLPFCHLTNCSHLKLLFLFLLRVDKTRTIVMMFNGSNVTFLSRHTEGVKIMRNDFETFTLCDM